MWNIQGEDIPGRENSKYEGAEAGKCLAGLRNKKKAPVPSEDWMKGAGNDGRGRQGLDHSRRCRPWHKFWILLSVLLGAIKLN